MYMDPTLLQRSFWFDFEITIADVYPASLCGPMYRRREPRWISARLSLIGSKASTFAMPIHTRCFEQQAIDRLLVPISPALCQFRQSAANVQKPITAVRSNCVFIGLAWLNFTISAMLKIPTSSKHKLRQEMRSSNKQAASRDIHQGLSWHEF